MEFEFNLDETAAERKQQTEDEELRPKLLYVDDEPGNLQVFESYFRDDFQIVTAESGEKGMELLSEHDFDVIVSDQRMPKMLGTKFLEQARSQTPLTTRIILTGYSDVEDIIDSINSGGVYRYVVKPWDVDELRMTLNNAVEYCHLARNNVDLIEDLKRTNEELESALNEAHTANRLKDEFLANVSHELRTPLNSLLNIPAKLMDDFGMRQVLHCEACDEQYETKSAPQPSHPCPDCQAPMIIATTRVFTGDGQTHHYFLSLADENARRLLHVVDNILAISQLEGGHLKLQPTSTNLSSLIEGVVEENQHTARTRGVTIESSITLKGETASLDQEKTIQVLNILLDNAIEFSKQGDSIAVSVEEESNSTYVFSVCDRGVGIPVDEFSNIFDKFRQIDGSHTRSHQGLGLGLAIAKGLVELHGGLLMVESTVDKGSTFRFTVQAGPG